MAMLFLSISVVIRLEQFEIYLLELLNSFGSFQQKKTSSYPGNTRNYSNIFRLNSTRSNSEVVNATSARSKLL